EVKRSVSADAVRSRIETDLGLTEKNKKYVCFLHQDDPKNPNMSFNPDRKDFHCFRCNGHYDIFDHYTQHYNLGFAEATQKIIDDFMLNIDIGIEPKKKPREPITKHTQPTSRVLEYIRARGLTDATIKHVGLKMDKDNVVFEYYDQFGNHEANKYRPAKKYKKDESKQYWWKGSTDALYNMQNIDITKPLVICEGEFDCIALVEAGIKNAVSPKAGAKSYEWIDKNWDWLKQFDEITLWYDNDNAGKEGVQTISSRLDNCTSVVYCTIANDINEVLGRFGKEEVVKQINNAKVLDVDGVITTSQIEEFNVYEAEKVKSGIRMIDTNILGFVAGSLIVITGYNGSGKSTIINQMCIAESISQGYKVFAFSGE
ncbi:MAG: toprim domain-containing protein, partial [Niameybacter sp.]